MKVLIAASEAIPFAKTGGLADVTGSLLKEFRKTSHVEAFLMLPLYNGIREKFDLTDTGIELNISVGSGRHRCRVWSYAFAYFLECVEYFDRPELYGTPKGDYPDNAARFAFFGKAVLEACTALGLKPDVIHCNDWQAGLIPLYLKTLYDNDFFRGTATVMTIHNIGYQGMFTPSDLPFTGLGPEWFQPEGIEFYGKINFLKAGLIAADTITTVSPTYAREILTPECGYGLEGVLKKRSRDLYGIVNGIDVEEWDPQGDILIPANYGPSDLGGKEACRKRLSAECSLGTVDSGVPLVAFVGRLSEQKGLDIFLDSVEDLLLMGMRLIILGKGDERLQTGVAAVADRHKGSVFAKIGYDEALAHRIYAGSDLFLMPSRYEPCGLGQMIAMRYGTIPVARRTGGLADTITDYDSLRGSGTGFLFEDYGASDLKECVKRAFCVYADKKRWKRMVAGAMERDFSWGRSARAYRELYMKTIETKRLGRADK